jgi:MoaA/NifB/PqqE/SkfB family radical SAM enzyme
MPNALMPAQRVLPAARKPGVLNDYGWSHLSKQDKRNILRGIRDGTAHGGPFHVEIHPSSRCGLNCFFCSTHSWRAKQDLPLETVKNLAAELRTLGTRSVCLSGGGEPLSHPQAIEVIQELADAGVPVSHLTTNGQNMGSEVAELLIDSGCSQVICSLNCGDEASYAQMMKTTPAMFQRVIKNIAGFIACRRTKGTRKPALILQFLIYKHNFETIPAMYDLARSLDVDGIIFNGLSFLSPEMRMTGSETERMISHLRTVMLEDEFRCVLGIGSFEQDVSSMVSRIEAQIGERRSRMNRFQRLCSTLARPDFSTRQKWEHHWKMRRLLKARQYLTANVDPCIRPWYSMTVRTDGKVPVCCARQDQFVADLTDTSVADVWHGPRFNALRRGMRRAIVQGDSWSDRGVTDEGVAKRCSAVSTGIERCPFRSFYFRHDLPFYRHLASFAGSEELAWEVQGSRG